MKYLRNILLLCFALLIVTGCGAQPRPTSHGPVDLGSWIVYWDAGRGLQELKSEKALKNVSLFSASFDKNDELCLPVMFLKPDKPDDKDSTITYAEMVQELKKMKVDDVYICINNDVMKDGNQEVAKLKDLDVLRRVLADDEAIEAHADSIINLAKELKCDGVEIDYERLWKKESDDDLRKGFLQLTYKLQRKAVKENLKLRIVLEPSADMGSDFCKGPEYVVMLYNLYGGHSGPGPKADYDFIEKIIKKMSKLPDNKSVAISTGGCIWEADKKGRFITEDEVLKLADEAKAKPERDNENAALHFKYSDKNGKDIEVWYADGETLTSWIAESDRQGISQIYLWRLGGNTTINQVK